MSEEGGARKKNEDTRKERGEKTNNEKKLKGDRRRNKDEGEGWRMEKNDVK